MTPLSSTNLIPAEAIHPGEILADELEAQAISQTEFAKIIGLPKSQLNELIKGKRDFSSELCLLVAKALNADVQIWLNLKNNFELEKARLNEKTKKKLLEIDEWNKAKELVPLVFLKKNASLFGNQEWGLKEVLDFYEIRQMDELPGKLEEPHFAYHRKSEKAKVNWIYLKTWEILVRNKARQLKSFPFLIQNETELIEKLKAILLENNQTLIRCSEVLLNHGIKCIFQPKPDACAVDGFSYWEGNNPTIALSLRIRQLDSFAFTLFHELGHVYLHLTKDPKTSFLDIEDENGSYGDSQMEKEANAYACNQLIPQKIWDDFKTRPNSPSDDDYTQLAKKLGIHPSIPFGRYAFEMKRFRVRTRIARDIG